MTDIETIARAAISPTPEEPVRWWGFESPGPDEDERAYLGRFRAARDAGELIYHAFAGAPGQGLVRAVCGQELRVFAGRTRMSEIERGRTRPSDVRLMAGLRPRGAQTVCPACRALLEAAR